MADVSAFLTYTDAHHITSGRTKLIVPKDKADASLNVTSVHKNSYLLALLL